MQLLLISKVLFLSTAGLLSTVAVLLAQLGQLRMHAVPAGVANALMPLTAFGM
jgi:hypothetical protein